LADRIGANVTVEWRAQKAQITVKTRSHAVPRQDLKSEAAV